MSRTIEFVSVNKFEAGWHPTSLYTGFLFRATLKKSKCMITRMNSLEQMERKLKREFGEEGEDWMVVMNDRADTAELYLKTAGQLVTWKLQDHEAFNELFESMERHVSE